MRKSRPILAGGVMLALVAGLAVGATAQTEEEAPADTTAPVVVSGTLECLGTTDEVEAGESVVNVHAWQADDARLTGDVEYSGRWQLYEEPEEDRGTVHDTGQTAVYEIVNDGGRWLCEAARAAEPRIADTDHTLVFHGQEGYEGLTAYLHIDWSEAPYNFVGLIMEGEAPEYAPPAQ